VEAVTEEELGTHKCTERRRDEPRVDVGERLELM
jgi:hypothetical protein